MSRDRDFIGDASTLLTLFFVYQVLSRWDQLWRRDPWWEPEYTDKGGRGAGPGATTAPVPQGGANVWSEETMRLFAREMAAVPIAPRLVLLGIAAASNFNADAEMGDNNVGLLLLRRSDLAEVGVPIPETFGALDAPEQIPWIAKVLAYRLSDNGAEPKSVPDLAILTHPTSNPKIEAVVRAETARRAKDAQGQSLYIHHDNLLRHVLASP